MRPSCGERMTLSKWLKVFLSLKQCVLCIAYGFDRRRKEKPLYNLLQSPPATTSKHPAPSTNHHPLSWTPKQLCVMKIELLVFVGVTTSVTSFLPAAAVCDRYKRRQDCDDSRLHLTTITETNNGNDPLLPKSMYNTIAEGKIAVLPNFIPQSEIIPLRDDAQNLWNCDKFSTDALAGYGSTGKFDPTRDRAVLRLPQWKNNELGNYANRQRFGSLMADVRSELSYNLNRP
eukprot:scaffold1808_cov247-Chaetoceros_neogracile.AAC.10